METTKIRLASKLQLDSIVDGEGLRMVLWTQGCLHNCKGCHNKETHDMNGGFVVDVLEVKKEIENAKLQDGITLSGGDPFFQPDAVLDIATHCQKLGLNVWAYTGFTFDQLLIMSKLNPTILKLLNQIDVLVDGRFVLEKKSLSLKFRGSTNQRIINVKASLKQNRVVLVRKYIYPKKENKIVIKEKHLYV